MLLIPVHDPQIPALAQPRATLATAFWKPVNPIVGDLHPGQVRPRRPRLLTPQPLRPATALRLGGVRPGSSSRDGGIEELPELRDSRCSNRASLPTSCSLASVSSTI